MNLMLKTARLFGLAKPAGKPQARWVIDRRTGRPVRAWGQPREDEASSPGRPQGPPSRDRGWRRMSAAA